MNRLCQSYVALMLAPEGKDGVRTVPLVRIGAYEVRMAEHASARAARDLEFWLELYRCDTRSLLDSCRCWDLDEAETVAAGLIRRARQLAGLHSVPALSARSNVSAGATSGSFSDSSL